ncbi:hypothetical protein B488_02880 [Liberibacter crescens BT-1]|uniref:Uncharacterized protein n=1 Tax=Liberibacter crescens (strain BT-1) TaxID=1215343 RepID=L0EV58_LIBCB|nr:hypothetical protein B488_02880 [Liberibacter crescens BT-1]
MYHIRYNNYSIKGFLKIIKEIGTPSIFSNEQDKAIYKKTLNRESQKTTI